MSLSRRGFLGVLAGVLAAPAAVLAAKPKPKPFMIGEYRNVLFIESDQIPARRRSEKRRSPDAAEQGKAELAAWFATRLEKQAHSHAAGL